MYKLTHTYEDFDGNERTEDFYFNLTEKECLDLNLSSSGGINKKVQRIIQAQDQKEIVEVITQIIDSAYGEKSLDGKYFDKSEEALRRFQQTQAYSDIFIKLSTDDIAAAEFITNILPKELRENAEKELPKLKEELKEAKNLSDVAQII